MLPKDRLNALVAAILAIAPAGCAELDDEACLRVRFEAECPEPGEARKELVGDKTCETPVRKIVRTGELLWSADIEGQSGTYGYEDPYTSCCYEAAYTELEGQSCVVGRPIRVDGKPVLADAVDRGDWQSVEGLLAPIPRDHRAALARQWLDDARFEHASVAAFAKLTLELLALGAPAELVARAGAAQLDEIRHAEQCFALASALSGRPLGPGPLPVTPIDPDLVRLAVETFEDGCVGETLAVARAAAQLREERDPTIRAVLRGIVEDETRHATLAWDIVRWALEVGGESVRAAVATAAERVAAPDWQVVGVPEDRARAALVAAVDEVLRPSTAWLLAA